MPTRNGRNAWAIVPGGHLRLRNHAYRADDRPLLEGCGCYTCAHFTRAYLRHLFLAKEMLGPILVSSHNIAYYQDWMQKIRGAVADGRLEALLRQAETAAADQTEDAT